MNPAHGASIIRPKRRDSGSVTVWSIAFCLAIGLLGLTITDLWRAISAWRRVAGAADAAAVAGASGVDVDTFREDDVIQLDPAAAESLAHQSLTAQHDTAEIDTWTAAATTEEITVTVQASVELPLLGAFRDGPITMTGTATADPRPSG